MFKVRVNGFDSLMRKLEQTGQAVRPKVAEALNEAGEQVANKAQEKVPTDTKKLQESIKLIQKATSSKLEVIVDARCLYGVFVEQSTRPHRPPVSALAGWAKRKLGDVSLAYALANSIAKKGTLSQKFMEPTSVEANEIAKNKVSEALAELVRSV